MSSRAPSPSSAAPSPAASGPGQHLALEVLDLEGGLGVVGLGRFAGRAEVPDGVVGDHPAHAQGAGRDRGGGRRGCLGGKLSAGRLVLVLAVLVLADAEAGTHVRPRRRGGGRGRRPAARRRSGRGSGPVAGAGPVRRGAGAPAAGRAAGSGSGPRSGPAGRWRPRPVLAAGSGAHHPAGGPVPRRPTAGPRGSLARARRTTSADVVGHALEVGLVVDDAVGHGLRAAGPEGVAAGGGPGHQGAPGEHVHGGGGRATRDLLGGHPARRAHDGADHGDRGGLGGGGHPEVDDHGLVLGQQDVARLQVPVGDARPVDRVHRLGQGDRQGAEAIAPQRAGGGDLVEQGRAIDVAPWPDRAGHSPCRRRAAARRRGHSPGGPTAPPGGSGSGRSRRRPAGGARP